MTDFSRDLLFLLNDVGRLLRVEADKRARAHGMTRAQWGILIWLEREPGISQKRLAEFLEVEPITVARLIDRLEASGMVERRPDPGDPRIWRLHLREAALPVLDDIRQQRASMQAMLAGGIEPETVAVTTDALARMKEQLCAELGRRPERSEPGEAAERVRRVA